MALNVVLRSKEGEDIYANIGINIQKNPGRGSGAVLPKIKRDNNYRGLVIPNNASSSGLSADIQLNFHLHPCWTMSYGNDPKKYVEQVAADLSQYACFLQQRDVRNFENLIIAQQASVQSRNYNNNANLETALFSANAENDRLLADNIRMSQIITSLRLAQPRNLNMPVNDNLAQEKTEAQD